MNGKEVFNLFFRFCGEVRAGKGQSRLQKWPAPLGPRLGAFGSARFRAGPSVRRSLRLATYPSTSKPLAATRVRSSSR